jgi:predicted  nucleic acid-binding Zn ribbon protein
MTENRFKHKDAREEWVIRDSNKYAKFVPDTQACLDEIKKGMEVEKDIFVKISGVRSTMSEMSMTIAKRIDEVISSE